MQFFENQDKARNRSLGFYGLFCLSVAFFTLLFHFAAMIAVGAVDPSLGFPLWHTPVSLIVILFTTGPILWVSYQRIAQMKREGGHLIMQRMDAKFVEPFCGCPIERRLRNVVEEMAVASNQPMPEVFVLNEVRINAITVGMDRNDICLGVTKGALEHLSRDELQAIVAHEFSHILNDDVRLKTAMVGWLHGISFIHEFGERLMGEGEKRASVHYNHLSMLLYVWGLFFVVTGYLGYLQTLWIKGFFCRQRTYLADTYAVQFNRNPEALGNALKKAKNNSTISMLVGPSNELAHLFFTEACLISHAMHPPVEDRLDVIFEGLPGRHQEPTLTNVGPAPHHIPNRRQSLPSGRPEKPAMSPAFMLAALSNQQQQNSNSLNTFSFPMDFIQMEINTASAKVAILSVLGGCDESCSDDLLRTRFSTAYQASEPIRKIRLIEQAASQIVKLSPAELQPLEEKVRQLVDSDSKIDLFEFMVLMILKRHVRNYFSDVEPIEVKYHEIGDLVWEISVLVSAVSISGSCEVEAELAFEQGAQNLVYEIGTMIERIPTEQCHWSNIELAVSRFSESADGCKTLLVSALRAAAKADSKVVDNELHLIQAICAAIDTPLPELMAPMAG